MSAGCPRCGTTAVPTGSGWSCAEHGPVEPLRAPAAYGPATLAELLTARDGPRGPVPLWLPWPMPTDWAVAGLRWAGGEHAQAIAAACTGPALMGGVGELLVVAERPGIGLGARFAGHADSDPGPGLVGRPADARVVAGGHLTPLWSLPTTRSDRAAYVGEALGLWLWVVVRPDTEWLRVLADLALVDALDRGFTHEVPSAVPAGLLLE